MMIRKFGLNTSSPNMDNGDPLESSEDSVVSHRTPRTAVQVKRLSISYQTRVSKAAGEIERLLRERRRLEMKQGKILQENIHLALEAKNLISDKKLSIKLREELIKTNDEYCMKVEHLVAAEIKRFEQQENLIKENEALILKMNQERENSQSEIEEERADYKLRKDTLVQAVQGLLTENGLLIQEKENAAMNTPNSHQELNGLHKQSLIEREVVMDCLRSEGGAEMEQREMVEEEVEHLTRRLERKMEEMDGVITQLSRQKLDLKSKFTKDLNMYEKQEEELMKLNKSRRNENREKKEMLNELEENIVTFKCKLADIQDENWKLIDSKKKSEHTDGILKDIQRESEELEFELKVEKEKVSGLLAWRKKANKTSQEIELENRRLKEKCDFLENLLGKDATDIDNTIAIIDEYKGRQKII